MYEIEHILVPSDFSSSSRTAFNFASSFEAARTHVFHIADRWPDYMERVLFPYAPLGEDDVEFEYELITEARRELVDFLDLEDRPDHVDEPGVEMGHPRRAIAEYVKSRPADLVVMGAFGETGAIPASIGSVADRTLRTVRQPVILVRDFDPRPRIRRIVAAIDLSESSHHVLRAAIGVARMTGAEMRTLFVVPDPLRDDTQQILDAIVKFDRSSALDHSRDRVRALFDNVVKKLDVPYSLRREVASLTKRRQIRFGDPADAIADFARETGADLVAVGTQSPSSRRSSRLGRVTTEVLRSVMTHLMVVPVEEFKSTLDEA